MSSRFKVMIRPPEQQPHRAIVIDDETGNWVCETFNIGDAERIAALLHQEDIDRRHELLTEVICTGRCPGDKKEGS